jgi:hypothetical protein
VGKMREISALASMNKINLIRKSSAKLINLKKEHSEPETLINLDNVFVHSSDIDKEYSMSVYNKSDYFKKAI